jgi:hypothetical protein
LQIFGNSCFHYQAISKNNEIGKKFPFKININEIQEQSLVEYKIKCPACNEIYIGKTERILAHRIKEHNSKYKKNRISRPKLQKRKSNTHNRRIDRNN